MSDRFRRRFRPPPDAGRVPGDVDEELRLHVDLRAAELEAEGLPADEARKEAERLFGDPTAHREQVIAIDRHRVRTERRSDWLDALRQDVAFALRAFARRPLLAAVATAVLALGIGSNSAVFSLLNAVLLRPLPFQEPGRLLTLRGADPEGDFGVSERERLRYREENAIFAGVGSWTWGTATIAWTDGADRLAAAYVDADVLPVAGIQPVLGRGFSPDEDVPGADVVVVLSHAIWQTRFGGDPGALGQTLSVGGQPRTIIGVLPPEARLPGDFAGPPVGVYLPLAPPSFPDPRNIHYLETIARLAPGVTRAAAERRLEVVARDLSAEIETLPAGFRISTRTVEEAVLGESRPAVLLLVAACGLLLLLVCVNIAGLLLAQADTRRQEFAMRTALGATGGRLVRQLVTESLVLGAAGGVVGLVLGNFALNGLLAASPPGLPRAETASLDPIVVLFTLGAALLTALAVGLIPAMTLRRRDPQSVLRGGGRGATTGRDRHLVRRGLVLGEVLLAVAIAIGAGLIVRSWLNVVRTDPGFGIENRLTFQLSLPAVNYPTREARWRFYREAMQGLRTVPGAVDVGAVSALPLAQEAGDWGFLIEGRPPVPEGQRNPFADRVIVTPGYFEAMGLTLREGRTFEVTDDTAHAGVVILNEAVAQRYWPEGGALGARLRISSDVDPVWRTVVGIVADARTRSLEQEPRPEFYFPHAQWPGSADATAFGTMSVVARTGGDPEILAEPMRRIISAIDPGVPLSQVRSMSGVLDSTLAVRRFQVMLLAFFATTALLLVAIGVYGVVAFLAAQRTREFGVRMALGASRAQIRRLVVRDAVALGGAGVVLGVLGALAAGRLLQGLLYGVASRDPGTMALVPVLVLGVVVAAALGPAMRAARTDPGAVLRE